MIIAVVFYQVFEAGVCWECWGECVVAKRHTYDGDEERLSSVLV